MRVILLRSPSDGPGGDPYETAFTSRGHHASSVPTLETSHTNLDELRNIITFKDPSTHFGGVIVTSSRAAEAWRIITQELFNSSPNDIHDKNLVSRDGGLGWSNTPFYVVGEGTAGQLRDIERDYPSRFSPHCIRGAESGGDEKLAQIIIEDLKNSGPSGSLRVQLLYLVGDKSRDTIPRILGDAGISLRLLQVYETRGSSTFERDLSEAIKSLGPQPTGTWITFFAPSSAKFTLPFLTKRFHLRRTGDSDEKSTEIGRREDAMLLLARVAAIGSTTSSALRNDLHIHVDLVSPKPGAEPLARAIEAFEDQSISMPSTS